MMPYIELNVTGFIENLTKAQTVMRSAMERGMEKAVTQLLDDTINESPGVPLRDGPLRDSGTAYVGENRVAGGSTPLYGGAPAGEVTGTVVFDGPYAAYQHEGMRADGSHVVKNYTTAGTGAKYLETKLVTHRDKYLGIIAGEMNNA